MSSVKQTNEKKLQELTTLIIATHRMIREKAFSGERIDPLTMVRMEALRFIEAKKGATMKEIADNLSIRASSATSLVNGLVKGKLLDRHENSSDRRVVKMKITPAGKRELERARSFLSQKMKHVFNQLSGKDIDKLLSVFKNLKHSFETYKK